MGSIAEAPFGLSASFHVGGLGLSILVIASDKGDRHTGQTSTNQQMIVNAKSLPQLLNLLAFNDYPKMVRIPR
jgi:hypothetical protein